MTKKDYKQSIVTDNSSGDNWLTPPDLLKALGKFDYDPACPNVRMPWRTATTMISETKNGLLYPWKGRVWLNPPYSNVLPWIERMINHNHGMMLVYAKSTDSRWGQLALANCASAFFFAGRLLFFYPDGSPSKGKWCSNMLLAFGKRDDIKLREFARSNLYPGVLMERTN